MKRLQCGLIFFYELGFSIFDRIQWQPEMMTCFHMFVGDVLLLDVDQDLVTPWHDEVEVSVAVLQHQEGVSFGVGLNVHIR